MIITDVEGCEITDSLTIQNTDPVGKDFYVKKDTVYISQNGLVEFKTSSTEPVSCIWDFGDGSYKSTITEPFHMYDETGEYIATLIATNNICTDTSYFKITVMDEPILPNGMPEFSFYPNPVITSSLNVHAEGIRDIELYVNIYNNKGDLVYTELIIKANGEFNTTIEMDGNFHAGSYILILSSPFRVFSKEKIIVTSN